MAFALLVGGPIERRDSRVAAARFRFPAAGADHEHPPLRSDNECWVVQECRKVRLGPPACLEAPEPPARFVSVTEEQWLEWRQHQLNALSTAEVKAAAREADAGATPRVPAQGLPSPRARSANADGSAGTGTAPLAFEQRFMDRAAFPKGVSFGRADVPTVSIDSDTPRDHSACDADAAMHGDVDDPAGGDHDNDDAVAGGAVTPAWPPADATLAQLGDWLETIRRLPADEFILARQGALTNRIDELRRPMPASRASPPTLVLRAKRATEKRRRQLARFVAMRDALLAEERTLQLTIAGAHATIEATEHLLAMAEADEYERFCEFAATQDAPGRVPSPEAADSASADAACRYGCDPDAAIGVSGITMQLLMLPTAAEASNLSATYAAVLEQARLVHKDLTGDVGPTLEPVSPAQGQVAAGGGGAAPRVAWVPGSVGHGLAGMLVPPADAAAHALAARPSAMGPPVSHGGYAGEVLGCSAPTPVESAGHEARVRAASRSLERSRPPSFLPPAGSRGEERERSPRGTSALAVAFAAAAAEAEAEAFVSTDDYMPDAEPHADAGERPAPLSASSGSGDSIGELRIKAASAAAILRCTIGARGLAADVEAARAEADDAHAAIDAALAGPICCPREASATGYQADLQGAPA